MGLFIYFLDSSTVLTRISEMLTILKDLAQFHGIHTGQYHNGPVKAAASLELKIYKFSSFYKKSTLGYNEDASISSWYLDDK